MDKMTLRRIGWIGASLGLTSALVGCQQLQSDSTSNNGNDGVSNTSGYLEASNGLTDMNGMNGLNGLNGHNGLNGQNGLWASNGLQGANGLGSINGMQGVNGFQGSNGFGGVNGWKDDNGLQATNGLNVVNGLQGTNGLSAQNGYMTSEHGRMIVQYLVRCALASGDSLVKQDQNGNNFTYQGGLGLAPSWKTGGCGKDCSEMISACMMAHINSSGTHIPLWMDSPDSVGWGTSPSFPTREGTFFGELMVVNSGYNLDGYYCYGPGADQNVVPGRLGANQGSVPYSNAWPTSAGFDGLCETTHKDKNGVDHGNCTAHTTGGVIDGDSSCTLNGTVFSHPMTVWRGATYQAESAEGGGFDGGNVWQAGQYGFTASDCTTPGTNGCAIIVDANNGMGKRVGYIGNKKGVKFTIPKTTSSTMNIIVYYTLGDAFSLYRNLQFVVSTNGNVDLDNVTPQIRHFGGLQDWSHPRGAAITLSGFSTSSTNYVYVTADPTNGAPDLDWIEVVNTSSTVPNTGVCTTQLWSGSASVNNGASGGADDGDLTTRWTTGRAMQNGDYFQEDFGGNVTLSSITLNNSNDGSSGDYPKTLGLFTSQDGTNFSSVPVATFSGATNSSVSFTSDPVRAIRVKILDTGGNTAWWSIGEVQAGCSL
jgi:hypothetical protein